MTTANVYLTFNGNCLQAFNFYKSVFGGDFPYVGKYSEMPPQEGMPPLSDNEKDNIMHISLPISQETSLMGCDSSESFGSKVVMGSNFSISINTDSTEEADRLFNQLSKGGKVTMSMGITFWGSYFGMFTDQFGINWMISKEAQQH